MKHILIIDDDIHINDMLDKILTQEGYRVSHAYSGTEALLFLSNSRPDLILLDLMLPGLSGEEILPQIADIPVIVMSAKADIKGKVALLLNGAADYITKPFEIEELLARITVQFRKTSGSTSSNVLKYDCITLNPATREVLINSQNVRLTKTEFAILKLLMENPKQIITKNHSAGPDQRRYSRLYGKFTESSYQQPEKKTKRRVRKGLYRGCLGNRV